MKYSFKTENTCAQVIQFDMNDDIITNVEFLGGGCPGNLQALPRLVEGMTTNQIQEKLSGIICGRRGTSCADQLARAVKEASEKVKQTV